MTRVRTDDGVNLSYRVIGDGPTNLLFWPSWGMSSVEFDDVIHMMDPGGMKFIVFDPRGTGDSDKPETGYTLERLAEDTVAVADAAEASTFIILGHSLGGKIAAFIACTWPQRVTAQILVTPAPPSPVPVPAEEELNYYRDSAGKLLPLLGDFALVMHALPEGEARARMHDDIVKCSGAYLKESLRIVGDDFSEKAKSTRCPTLIIGSDDPLATVALMRERILPLYPGARLAYLPGAGHVIPYEAPGPFVAVLEAFLAGLPR